MLEFLASEWNTIIRSLEKLTNLLNLDIVRTMSSGDKAYFIDPLRQIADSCILLGLNLSASYAEEIIKLIEGKPSLTQYTNEFLTTHSKPTVEPVGPEQLTREMLILRKRIDDELKNRQFLAILPEKSRFYKHRDLFGVEVSQAFPSASYDTEEAGTCYACGRSTATVFHLMRVMEAGLRVLGASLNNPNLDPRKNPTWERILKLCDDELKKPGADRCAEWRVDDLFFSNATANLRAVKDAWRNPAVHVEINYDEDRALEILTAVKAFMRHLAGKLRE